MKTTVKTDASDELASLRAMLVRGGRGSGYGAEARKAAVEYAGRARAAGATASEVAKRLGVHPMTLSTWMKATASPTSAFVAVAVHDDVARRGVTLVSPTGWRIEGLDVDTLRGLVLGER